jgi:hypothetical protein
MSLGVRIPADAAETTEKPVELKMFITDLISPPLETRLMMLELSASPKVSVPAPTTCTVLAEPRPSLMVRLMPSCR